MCVCVCEGLVFDLSGIVLGSSHFYALSTSINLIAFILANFIWKSKDPSRIKTLHDM